MTSVKSKTGTKIRSSKKKSKTAVSNVLLTKFTNVLPALIISSLGITSLTIIYKIRKLTKGLTVDDVKFIQDMILKRSRNPFQILNVSSNASPEEIKKVCADLYREYHPDKTRVDKDLAQIKFQEIRPICEKLEKKEILAIFKLIFPNETGS